MTIQRHLAQRLDARPYKRPKWPKITQRIKENRLKFARDHENWSFEDWNNVFWSDESPFELFHSPNRQNDRVWAIGSQNIEPIFQVKFPAKIMVWGMMSHRALSELHIVPQKQTVNGAYYRNEILKKTCLDAIARKAKKGSVIERSMLEKHVRISVHAGWCPRTHSQCHAAVVFREVPSVLEERRGPANSPDLNPIENLWGILYKRLDEMSQVTTIQALIANLKTA